MQHGLVRPLALVHVIHILRLTTEVDDAKVAAAGWEAIGCGFTDVVEARPDKLSTAIRRMLHHVPVLFVRRTPRGMHVVVGRTHETGVGIGQPPLLRRLADGVAGHHVVACRLQGGDTFRHDERTAGEVLGHVFDPLMVVVEADDVDAFSFEQVIVGRRFVTA